MTAAFAIDFLTAPGCGGALTIPERLRIRDLAAELSSTFGPHFRAVNLGVDQGGTLWCIRAGAPECELIGVDINPDSARGNWHFIHGDSRRVHAQVSAPLHLLLVDGDHDYYGVRADILNWYPKVTPGGLIMFHDYGNGDRYPWTAGVKRAVDEFMLANRWETVGTADSLIIFRKLRGPEKL